MSDLLAVDGDDVRLIGGYSPTSGHHHFPLSPVCPYTGADDVERVTLPTTGTLWAWTSVTTPPPGYDGPIPYGFGVVELPEGLRVLTRLTEADPANLRFGQGMRLELVPLHTDDEGREVLTWAFG